MSKRTKSFYLKCRDNPQLGRYWVKLGQLSKAAAKRAEGSIYGSNTVIEYATEAEYLDRIKELESEGEKIQG